MYLVLIKIDDRIDVAQDVQEVLTRYGKSINTRLGIRGKKDVFEGNIIIVYDSENIEYFIEEFKKFDGVKVNYMEM